MLGALVASAVARPRTVAVLTALSTLAGAGRALSERLSGPETWTRVALLAAAGFASWFVALVRTRQERELAKAVTAQAEGPTAAAAAAAVAEADLHGAGPGRVALPAQCD